MGVLKIKHKLDISTGNGENMELSRLGLCVITSDLGILVKHQFHWVSSLNKGGLENGPLNKE